MRCTCCGKRSERPVFHREDRGECFGFPAWEEVAGCPLCGGGLEWEEAELWEEDGDGEPPLA